MKRYKHSLSNYKLSTFDMGELVPVYCQEVLAGDAVQQASSALLRVSPLVAPVMHPVTVRIHHWYVPSRLLWDGWEDFITGGPDGLGGSSGAYPTVSSGAGGFSSGSLADYFDIPTGVANLVVGALPFRAYNLIYNEYYRDQDLITKTGFSKASGVDVTTATDVQPVAWEKDYFTSARPWTQKGPEVTVPVGGIVPVTNDGTAMQFAEDAAGTTGAGTIARGLASNPANVIIESAGGASGTNLFYKSGMQADMGAATPISINDLREAFAIQRYEEARAMYGSRYTEYLRYLGIRSSDARLQRPEYLGGGKQTIAFTEILQTGPDSGDTGVGSLKGHGIAAMRTRRYRRYFEEHGYIISLMSVRPRSMYTNGLHRMWSRRVKEDYWQKELENIGQQEVLNKEVYAAHATPDGIFGYQDRYAEYRHTPSQVSGDFRSTLNYWHMARIFGSAPALNSDFVKCVPTKRIHAVQTADVLWCMVSNSVQARRLVNKAG